MTANINGKPFTDVLGEIENGEVLRDLTRALYEVTRAVIETRKAGGLKLAIKLTPTGRGIQIDAKFESVVPEHDRPSTTFFYDEDGTLIRNDPTQPQLPLHRVVDAEDTEPVRRVAD